MKQQCNRFSAIIKTLLWCFGPTALLLIAGWIWLAPSEDEIRMGTAEPPLAVESRVGMASHAVGSLINMTERSKSMAWISKEWVVDVERHVKSLAEPIIYWVDYAFGRMIEIKFGIPKGLPRTLLMLATGVPVGLLLFFCGMWLIGGHMAFSCCRASMPAFYLSIIAGALIGMADLFQIGMEWYLLTTVAFLAGGACLLIAAGLIVFDIFQSKLWSLLLLCGCVYGFVLGVVLAGVLTILSMFAVIAIVISGIAGGGFQILSEPHASKSARLFDGTELEREYGDKWKDDKGRRWRNVGGNTFECEDEI